MGKSYRNRAKTLNQDMDDYLAKGEQKPGKPYTNKRKRLSKDFNKISAPPGAGALEEDDDGFQDDTRSGTGMEEILEAWKMYVEQEEEAPEIKNEEEGKDEDGLV